MTDSNYHHQSLGEHSAAVDFSKSRCDKKRYDKRSHIANYQLSSLQTENNNSSSNLPVQMILQQMEPSI